MARLSLPILSAVSFLGLSLLLLASWSYACNEAICASVVSKCMLTQSCKCDLVTCTCCKECFSCLSYLYDECCSCVDLCPKPNITDNPLSKKSHVEDFNEPVPGLFQALTAESDPHERWYTFTYPVDFDITLFSPKQDKDPKYKVREKGSNSTKETNKTVSSNVDVKFSVTEKGGDNNQEKNSQQSQLKPNVLTVNCTVAYMAHCNSWNKCRQACQSMGASSYRWFHDGCCECVGDTCINYGINESRCRNCPLDKEDDLKDQYDDYGQDEDELAGDEVD